MVELCHDPVIALIAGLLNVDSVKYTLLDNVVWTTWKYVDCRRRLERFIIMELIGGKLGGGKKDLNDMMDILILDSERGSLITKQQVRQRKGFTTSFSTLSMERMVDVKGQGCLRGK